ncbi:response regulator transcription factor [Sphingobium tyrosinilyticum]|uniref:Response regulator transcription factor n=1 Tax=Sphingobium tyrosinilyticum TaxID=2715436 RepID=A0ABV9F5V2_9SPHN
MSAKCSVFIVVDDARLRRNLVATLRSEQYQPTPYAAGSDFLEALSYLPAGVAIVDLNLPDKKGIDVLKQLLEERKDIPVIITADQVSIQMVVQMIKRGADDFLEQPFSKKMLLEVIDQSAALLQSRIELQQEQERAEACLQRLTKTEIDVLRSLKSNKSNQETAEELHLSIRTIETYRTRIMKKCGVTRFADAISIYSIASSSRKPH